ncbi:MAG: RNA polymerase sigma factor [bacterium]|nr:RNA polymerase sigma factor [bacterium]
MAYLDEQLDMKEGSEDTAPGHIDGRTDEELLKASIDDPSLFGLLIDRYQHTFFRVAYRVVRQKQEAEDVAQEAFTKMYLYANRFFLRPDGVFKAWGYTIVTRTALNHLRSRARHNNLEYLDDVQHEAIPAFDSAINNFGTRTIVTAALKEIPDQFREVIEKYYLEDKSYKMISAEMKISEPTLKIRLYRARKALKDVIGKYL